MMIAGFIVENFSNEGERLMQSLKTISPPVYVIFFTLAGASTNLVYLKAFWLFALILVFFRLVLKHFSTYLGSWLAQEEEVVKKRFGMAFISQAGLSLGMATIIEQTFGTFGQRLAVLIISIIVINQVIGPLLLKWVIEKIDPHG
jgi:Kef-type K+ transport system membrane component KefB